MRSLAVLFTHISNAKINKNFLTHNNVYLNRRKKVRNQHKLVPHNGGEKTNKSLLFVNGSRICIELK